MIETTARNAARPLIAMREQTAPITQNALHSAVIAPTTATPRVGNGKTARLATTDIASGVMARVMPSVTPHVTRSLTAMATPLAVTMSVRR